MKHNPLIIKQLIFLQLFHNICWAPTLPGMILGAQRYISEQNKPFTFMALKIARTRKPQ